LAGQFYKSGNELNRQVVDREVAEVLKRLQRRRHSRPAQPGYYNNRDRHKNPRRPASLIVKRLARAASVLFALTKAQSVQSSRRSDGTALRSCLSPNL